MDMDKVKIVCICLIIGIWAWFVCWNLWIKDFLERLMSKMFGLNYLDPFKEKK